MAAELGHSGENSVASSTPILSPFHDQLRSGLILLLQAYECARDTQCDQWEFGVELQSLRDLNVPDTLLRWLTLKGYVAHRTGSDLPTDGEYRLVFTSHSLFTLTESGCKLARQQLVSEVNGSTPAMLEQSNGEDARRAFAPAIDPKRRSFLPTEHMDEQDKPHWDPLRKELWYAGQLVKQFKLPSLNQETILMTFQEDGWPPKIDDPLPPQLNQNPQTRLQNTIKALNRSQKSRLLRFRGDGTGEGVIWEPSSY